MGECELYTVFKYSFLQMKKTCYIETKFYFNKKRFWNKTRGEFYLFD